MRRRVYPRWVSAQRMTQAAADHEIACMEAIVATLEAMAPLKPEMPNQSEQALDMVKAIRDVHMTLQKP